MALNEIQQVNAIIGLSMRIEGWPSTLADLGYTLDRIELKFKVPHPTQPGKTIEVNPDLLFIQDQRNCSLVVELKSGRFRDFIQLDRFVNIRPKELVRYGSVTLRNPSQVHKHKIGVVEIVNYEFFSEYNAEFNRVNHKACLVSIDKSLIQTQYGTIPDLKADREFKQGISLSGCRLPTKLVPVLPTTNEEYELVKSVGSAMTYLWINNTPWITLTEIAQTEFKQIWGCFDNEAQERYLRVARNTLNDMQETEFHEYLRPAPERKDRWRLSSLPDSIEERHRTQAYQRFNATAKEYLWRRKNNNSYSKRHPAQTNMADIEGWMPEDSE